MTIDIGLVRAVDVQTFGEPGQRTFRLRLVADPDQTASLWLEKQQLQALEMAFAQMLAQTGFNEDPTAPAVTGFPDEPSHDIRIGRIALGFDPANSTVIVHAFALENDDETAPSFSARLTRRQCASLIPQLREIIAAGRPQCPLCGTPDDGSGHACIRANGHSRQPIPDDRPTDET